VQRVQFPRLTPQPSEHKVQATVLPAGEATAGVVLVAVVIVSHSVQFGWISVQLWQ